MLTLQASEEAGDGDAAFVVQSPMRPATKRKRVAFNLGNQVLPVSTSATTTMPTRYVQSAQQLNVPGGDGIWPHRPAVTSVQ